MKRKCAIRIARRNTWQDIAADSRHGQRVGLENDARYDPLRRHLNQFGSDIHGQDGKDISAALKSGAEQHSAIFRANAAPSFEAIFIVSAEWLAGDREIVPGVPAVWDATRLESFKDKTLEACRRKFGPVAAWRLDLDETTPTLSVWPLCVEERTTKTGKTKREISTRRHIGQSRHQMSELQTWYAEAMAPLGLERGEKKVIPDKHITPREYYQHAAEQQAEAALNLSIAESHRQALKQTLWSAEADRMAGRSFLLSAETALQAAERQRSEAEEASVIARDEVTAARRLKTRGRRVLAWGAREVREDRLFIDPEGKLRHRWCKASAQRLVTIAKPWLLPLAAIAAAWAAAKADIAAIRDVLADAKRLVPHLKQAERAEAARIARAFTTLHIPPLEKSVSLRSRGAR